MRPDHLVREAALTRLRIAAGVNGIQPPMVLTYEIEDTAPDLALSVRLRLKAGADR